MNIEKKTQRNKNKNKKKRKPFEAAQIFITILLGFFYSAGSVGKDYYSDPKYLNVLTGAVGKLQEVIPSTTNSASHHLTGRNDAQGGPENKKGPKTFTAVTSLPSSLKYPQVFKYIG